MFYGRTDLQVVGSVGRSGFFFFFFFFFFSGSKNDPKHTQISKKMTFFAEKFWENILTYSQKFSAKLFMFLL